MNILVNLNLNKNELQNARIQNLATPPSSPVEGQIYYDTADDTFYGWDGTQWLDLAAAGSIDADTLDGQDGLWYLDRANHTGTQTASTISDFDTQVRTSRLDQMADPTASVDLNNQKIINLADPTNPLDAVNLQTMQNYIEGIQTKRSVRAATTADITLANEQTIDTVVLVEDDEVLVKNQNDPEENGLYRVVDGGAWVRIADWEEMVSLLVFVEEGSANDDTAWLSTIDSGGVLDTDPVTFVQFVSAGDLTFTNVGGGEEVFKEKSGNDVRFRTLIAGSSKVTITENANDITIDSTATSKYAANIGNGVLTTITVTHSLNTTDVIVMVRLAASTMDTVYPDIQVVDANNINLLFAVAPTTNQYRVIVIG